MAIRPTKSTAWATGPGGPPVLAAIPDARREEGWPSLQPPSAAYFNEWMNAVHQWVTYIDTTAGEIAPKGWVTVPTVTVAPTNDSVTVSSTGVYLSGGNVDETPSEASFSGFAASQEYFLAYVLAAANIQSFTTWDAANADTNVPLYWFKTDGAGLVGTGARTLIAKRVLEYPESLTLTVSQTPGERAHFQTLKEAIACARAIQTAAVESHRGIVIEVIGDVVEPASLDEETLYDARSLRFIGRSGQRGALSSARGARIRFAFTDKGLFHITGAAAISDWTFEHLTFRAESDATDARVGVVTHLSSSPISALRFERCSVDANGDAVGGASNFKIPNFIYSDGAASIIGLEILDCVVHTIDTMFRFVGSAVGVSVDDLVVRGVDYNHTGAGTIEPHSGLAAGFIIVGDTGSAVAAHERWRITDCKCTALDGPAIDAHNLKEAWIRDNWFELATDGAVIDLGNTTNYDNVEMVWIRDNYLRRTINPPSAEPLVHVKAKDGASYGSAQIFIHDNALVGEQTAAPLAAAIKIDSGANVLTHPIVHSNSCTRVKDGLVLAGNVQGAIALGNALSVKETGIEVPSTSSRPMVVGNAIANGGSVTPALDVNAPDAVVVGNYTDGSMTVGANADDLVATGNQLAAGVTLTNGADNIVLTGNWVSSLVYPDGATDLVATGNLLDTVTLTGVGAVLAGNRVVSTLSVNANAADVEHVIASNRLVTLTIAAGANKNVIASNFINGTASLGGDANVFAGNFAEVFTDIASGDNQSLIAANWINDAGVTTAANFAVMVGNYWMGSVELSGLDMVFTGNYTGGDTNLVSGSNRCIVDGNRLNAGGILNNTGGVDSVIGYNQLD